MIEKLYVHIFRITFVQNNTNCTFSFNSTPLLGPLTGGPHVACRIKELPMSLVT